MTESQLIAKCIKQDRRAQNELYKRYFPLISSLALRYTDNEDEAVSRMNMGFLKVLQNLKTYNPEFALATWIRNVMVNHLIDAFRKEKKYNATMQFDDFDSVEHDIDWNVGEQKLDADELFEILKSLPPMTEKIFNLFAIDGYKHKEIAELLAISEGTSKWHVSDARKKLKAVLQKQKQNEQKRIELNASVK